MFQSIEYCVTTAGFSVGEYAALVFSGAMSFQQGKLLVYTHHTELKQ